VRTLLLIAFYGPVPEHIRMTFGIGNAGCQYEVIREGEKIPDAWEQAVIVHGSNGHDALQGAQLLVQLKALNPTGIVFVLPVEVEAPQRSDDVDAFSNDLLKRYSSPYRFP
jgi:hypothetical protein